MNGAIETGPQEIVGQVNLSLDPRIQTVLRQFNFRKRLLRTARGACVLVSAGVVVFGLIAAADYIWVIEDSVRLGLSIAAYLIIAVLAGITLIRPWIGPVSIRKTALEIESLEPRLRNDLLSAVELGDAAESDQVNSSAGSPHFRQLLQRRVSAIVGRLPVKSLLPTRLLRRWAGFAAVVLSLLVISIVIPGSPVGYLYARALFPTANLPRISSTRITLIDPELLRSIVVANETKIIKIGVSGEIPAEAALQIVAEDGSRSDAPMHRLDSEKVFVANLDIGDHPVMIRAIAGDGRSRWHTLVPSPRPRVRQFQTSVTMPQYVDEQPRHAVSDRGDVTLLAGSGLRMGISANIPLRNARFEILDDLPNSDAPNEIAFVPQSDGTWSVELNDVTANQNFHVRLEARDTALRSEYPERYQITVVPDQPPRLAFTHAGPGTLMVIPSDLVALSATVEDELPIDSATLQVSRNDGSWQTVVSQIPLTMESDNSNKDAYQLVARGDADLDLAGIEVSEGDILRTRVSATDKKGQESFSTPLKILITSDDFATDRYAYLQARLDWLAAVQRWADGDQVDTAECVESSLRLLRFQIAGCDGVEIEWTSRAIAAVQHSKQAAADDQQVQQTKVASDEIRTAVHWFVAGTAAQCAAADMQALEASAARMVQQSRERNDAWNQRRLELLSANYQACSAQYAGLRDRLPESTSRAFEGLITAWSHWSSRIDNLLTDEIDHQKLYREQQFQLEQLMSRARNLMIDGAIVGQAQESLRRIDRHGPAIGDPIESMAKTLERVQQIRQKMNQNGDAETAMQLQGDLESENQAFKELIALVDTQLAATHRIHKSRSDGSPEWIDDLSLIRNVVANVLGGGIGDDPPEMAFAKIGKAANVLDAGQRAKEMHGLLRMMALDERWNREPVTMRVENPRRWDYWGRGIELATRRLQQAGIDQTIWRPFEQLRYQPPADTVGRTLSNRRWDANWRVTVADDLESIFHSSGDLVGDLAQPLEDARAVLRTFLPKPGDSPENIEDHATPDSNPSDSATDQLAKLPSIEPDALTQLGEMSAEELLRQLEAELEVSEPMRDELVDVVDLILAQARDGLQRAARQEAESQQQLERSDQALVEQKWMAANELQMLARQAEQVRSVVLQQGRAAAARGAAKEAVERIGSVMEKLEKDLQQAKQATEDQSVDSLRERAVQVREDLQETVAALREAETSARDQARNELETEPNRRRTREQMEDGQRQVRERLAREAQQRQKQWEQLENRVEQKIQNGQRSIAKIEERLESAREQLSKNPQDNGRQRNIVDLQRERAKEQAKVESLEQVQVAAKQRSAEAERQAVELGNKQTVALEGANPAAEMAAVMADEAARMTEQLAEQANQIEDRIDAIPGIQTDANQLSAFANQQQENKRQIEAIADNLQRAARHEERLGNKEQAAAINQAGRAIRAVGQNEIEAAAQTANQAVADVREKGDSVSSAAQGRAVADTAEPAERALESQAENLGRLLGTRQNETSGQTASATESAASEGTPGANAIGQDTGPSNPEASNPGTSNSGMSQTGMSQTGQNRQSGAGKNQALTGNQDPTFRARLLDDLDRALNQNAGQGVPTDNASDASITLAQRLAQREAAGMQLAESGQPSAESGQPSAESGQQGTEPGQTASVSRAGKSSASGNRIGQPAVGSIQNPSQVPLLDSMEDWGELRERETQRATEVGRDAVPEQYRKQIEAYFRSLAEPTK
jgi:hypothetical protein